MTRKNGRVEVLKSKSTKWQGRTVEGEAGEDWILTAERDAATFDFHFAPTNRVWDLVEVGISGTSGVRTAQIRAVPVANAWRIFSLTIAPYLHQVDGKWVYSMGPSDAFPTPPTRSGRAPDPRKRTDSRLVDLCARYIELARFPAPMVRLADERNMSIKTARNMIGIARKRGLLTRPEPGKAGGELTAAARKLLRDQREDQ